ncbi:chlorite dismutase [Roseateles chitinivorans]|uniref:chlorite dismutase n=1 Tax=Roseateles chitinivorans TaxID=2917965 RepID=UPI003D676723
MSTRANAHSGIDGGPSHSARYFRFAGVDHGEWKVLDQRVIVGEALADVAGLTLLPPTAPTPTSAHWLLSGVTSNERYVERDEKVALMSRQESLGRPAAARAALIPIRKNAAWWALTQDERRRIFEADSRHIAIGLQALPAIARRLHHCRDLPTSEPFDFLTWFEYAPQDEPVFDTLLRDLRATREWTYVDWEVELRLVRES